LQIIIIFSANAVVEKIDKKNSASSRHNSILFFNPAFFQGYHNYILPKSKDEFYGKKVFIIFN